MVGCHQQIVNCCLIGLATVNQIEGAGYIGCVGQRLVRLVQTDHEGRFNWLSYCNWQSWLFVDLN